MKKLLIIPAVALVAMMMSSFTAQSNVNANDKKDTVKADTVKTCTIKVGVPLSEGEHKGE